MRNIWRSLFGFLTMEIAPGQGPTRFQRAYLLFTYILPMFFALLLWVAVASPLWLGYRLKNRVKEVLDESGL